MNPSHRNIPIFIPHLGCPHQCVFCNQRSISGCGSFDEKDVKRQIETALETIPDRFETEIAYFGGSFTGIDRDLMIRLLELAEGYVKTGQVSGIRLSTRPDMIDGEILEILGRYSVKTVELGLQSMDDKVLRASGRGHTAKQAENACKEVVAAGFSLVGQMMIGLPGSDPVSECETARRICDLGASACRIYPTVVFRDTPLMAMTESGAYQPLTLQDAVFRAASVLKIFLERGVACLRIGLCANEDLISAERAAAGANHPALGELVWNELYYQSLYTYLKKHGFLGREVELTVSQREISKTVGQNRRNLKRLERESHTVVRKITGVPQEHLLTARLWSRK
ncbi:MAG: radical SAM protein [Clostridia bacterium]|nr:radical SAM protein [Clostridia bacterium]